MLSKEIFNPSVCQHLVEHLQGVAPVTVQPLALLGRLQAELIRLGLQSRHLLLEEDTVAGRVWQVLRDASPTFTKMQSAKCLSSGRGPRGSKVGASPHLPLGHAAVILGPLLEELLAHGFPLLLQAALPLQLLKLQVLKLLGSGLQHLTVLKEGEKKTKHHLTVTSSAL